MKTTTWIWTATLAGVLLYLILSYHQLPDRVASHFNAAGTPNGFQTKTGYLYFILGFAFLMNGLMGLLHFFPAQIPASLLNIPWKAYWLSTPDRMKGFHQRLKQLAGILGIFLNLVYLFIEQVVYQANVQDVSFRISINGGAFFILLGGLALAAFTFLLFRPPAEDGYS